MEFMKQIRLKRKKTIEDLAEETSLSKAQLWSYEADRRDPPLYALCSIADALDVSIDYLVRGKEKDRSKKRSKEDLLKMYDEMTEDELSWQIAILQAALADKRFQAHLRQDDQ